MRLGKRKLIVAIVATAVVGAAVTAAWFEAITVLLLIVVLAQVAGFATLGQFVMSSRRTIERRLDRLGSDMAAHLRKELHDDHFVEHLRSAALPQQHAAQLLRTIEARHAYLETVLDQLREHMDPRCGEPEEA